MTKDQFDTLLPLKVPAVIAVCPICGDCIYIDELQDWGDEYGQVVIYDESSVSVDCGSAPDIDSPEWTDWFNGHWSEPYMDWLPITIRVRRWLQDEIQKPEMLAMLPGAQVKGTT